jgi:hypothetical protein
MSYGWARAPHGGTISPQVMQYEQVTVGRLIKLVVADSYVGGTTSTWVDDLEDYIEHKRLIGDVRAVDEFEWCGYVRVPNVQYTEDGLLEVGTNWNRQKRSGLAPVSGIVYLLRRSRPMTAAGRTIVTATVVGGLAAIIGGIVAFGSKPPPPPAPQPPPAF